MNKSTAIRVAWLFALLAICISAEAQASRTYVLDIPRLPIAAALRELSAQTQMQIGGLYDVEVMVGPLKGSYTIDAALTRLLARAGFTFKKVNDTTYSVQPPTPVGPLPAAAGAAWPGSDEYSSSPEEVIVPGARMGEELLFGALDWMTVTGTRITVTGEGPAPVGIFSRESIEKLGVATVSDLLKHIPQQPYTRTEGYRMSGQQYAELRGLGADTTLVLINGRWVAPTAGSVGQAFDLNTIPSTAIERVEVLPDPAAPSANAVGGVVNIILRKAIPRPVVELQYGAARGGAEERRISMSTGYSNEALQAAIVLDYFERDFLQGEKRALWSDQDYRRYGSVDWRSSDGTITSLSAANLPGLPSRFAAIPAGGTHAQLTPEDFRPTAGQRNSRSLYQFFSVVPAASRVTAAASAELRFSGVVAFGELLYAERDTASQLGPPMLAGVLVPASNAFNPFGVPVMANFLLSGIDSRQTMTHTALLRSVAGLRGQWGSRDWELSVQHSDEYGSQWTRNDVSAARVAAALAAPDPTRALNVFQDGPGGSPELLASLIDEPAVARYWSGGTEASLSLSGQLFALPAGKVLALLGGQWRQEAMSFDDVSLDLLRRAVSAGFVELQLPLAKAIRLTVAGRFDHYSDCGDVFNPRYGFVWNPIAPLLMHASYGTHLSPPSLYELRGAQRLLTRLVDHRRNHELAAVTVLAGGNPDLGPATADSWTAGATLTPGLSDLRISVEYWRIRMDDRVVLIPASLLLDNEARFTDRVMRADPTAADVAAGLPGALTFVDISRMNFGQLETSGVDFSLSRGFDSSIGRFIGGLSATFVNEFATADLPGTPVTDRAGVASPLGTIAKWRATASMEWRRNGTSLSAHVRYLAAYDDVGSAGRNGRTVPAQTTVDMRASFRLDRFAEGGTLLRDVEIAAGVLNVLDQAPPFAEVGMAAGYDLSQGDLRQRFGYLKISKRF